MTCAQGLLRLLWGGPEVGVLRDCMFCLQAIFFVDNIRNLFTKVSQKVTQFLSQEAFFLMKFGMNVKAHIVMRFSCLIVLFRIVVGIYV